MKISALRNMTRSELLNALAAVILCDLFGTTTLGINLKAGSGLEVQGVLERFAAPVLDLPALTFLALFVPLAVPVAIIGLRWGWHGPVKYYTYAFCAIALLFCARAVSRAL